MQRSTFAKKRPKLPRGKIAIIALRSCKELGEKVNQHLVSTRKEMLENENAEDFYIENVEENYLVPVENIRFSNGEGKAIINESVRGKDIYILADIGNYSCTYNMFGFTNHMGPDEHFQDIKRTISAIGGHARRVTVVMPLLYSSRQDKRNSRESLDCAMALQELERLGVKNIITFDAHETKVQNAIPLISFESLHSTYGILKSLIEEMKGEKINKENMVVISPDAGGMSRAIYYGSILNLDVGLFYKRRDYSVIVNGTNPIVQHEYMGPNLKGKKVLVVDDMIASGGSVLDLVEQIKERGCDDIYIGVAFAFFTEGLEKFDDYYKKGYFKKVFATNLTYTPQELLDREWFISVDMSKHLGNMLNRLNFSDSVSSLFNATTKIKNLLKEENMT